MNYLKMILLLLGILCTACNASKSQDIKEETVETMTEETNKMLEAGYKRGTIIYSDKENDCEYTIKMEGNSAYYLDPITLDESFKKDGENVWIKFRGLRRMSRCEKANPIELTEIRKRAE